MANWKKQREIAISATANQLINSDAGENDYGYHVSKINGESITWRYHKQTASNAYELAKAGNATHIIITDIPNFSDYEKGISTNEFENRIIKL